MVRELERVGEQVLDDLLQPLAVGRDRARQQRVELHQELDAAGLGHVAEGSLDVVVHSLRKLLHFCFHPMNLRRCRRQFVRFF